MAGATLGSSALVTRLLTPSQAGDYSLAAGIVAFAAIIGQLGLPQVGTRLVAEAIGLSQPRRARNVIERVLVIGSTSAAVMVAVLAFGLPHFARRFFHSPGIAECSGLIALWGATIVGQAVLAQLFRGFHDIRLASILEGGLTNVLTVLGFSAVWVFLSGANFREVTAIRCAAGVICVLVGLIALWPRFSRLQGAGGSVSTREVLGISGSMLVASIGFSGISPALLCILGAFRAQQQVALYAMAARLVLPIGMLLGVVNGVIPPLIAELSAQRKSRQLEHMLQGTAALAGVPAVMLLLTFLVFGRQILGAVYGPFYRQAADVLAILTLGECVNVLAGSCGYALIMTGHHKLMASITIVSGLISIVLSVLLVRGFGAAGVALACTSGIVLSNLIMVAGVKVVLDLWTCANPRLGYEMLRSAFGMSLGRRTRE